MEKANILTENLFFEAKEEPKIIKKEEIDKKLKELKEEKEKLTREINLLKGKLERVNTKIEKWQKDISPNQTSMF